MASPTTIGSLALGINIIDVVAKSDIPLKFSDIQEQTGISKSNLYKYLNTLTQMNLLYRDQMHGAYSLGYKFLEYGTAAMHNADFMGRLTPYFKEVSHLTNMSTLLTTWVNDAPIVTNIWNTNYGLSIGAQIGTQLPLTSATGKIYAAFANTPEIGQWIEQEQEKIENFDMVKFQRALKTIRAQKFAYAEEPLVKHVSSIGFPILNFNKELVASFTVVGFSEDVPNDVNNETVQKILAVSAKMSSIYGYKEEEED